MLISNVTSIVTLSIFENETIHLPFHIESIPSKEFRIIVKRYKKDGTIILYLVDKKYNLDLDSLLRDLGIEIKNEKYYISNEKFYV